MRLKPRAGGKAACTLGNVVAGLPALGGSGPMHPALGEGRWDGSKRECKGPYSFATGCPMHRHVSPEGERRQTGG